MTPDQQKWLDRQADKQQLKPFAKEMIAKEIDDAKVTINSKADLKNFLRSLRESGQDHLFAGPERVKEKTGDNPWAADTWNVTKQGMLIKSLDLEAAAGISHAANSHIGATRPSGISAAEWERRNRFKPKSVL